MSLKLIVQIKPLPGDHVPPLAHAGIDAVYLHLAADRDDGRRHIQPKIGRYRGLEHPGIGLGIPEIQPVGTAGLDVRVQIAGEYGV